jgi:hypothetical protein
MNRRALGLLAAGITAGCALLLGAVASAAGSTGIPSEMPRGVLLGLLLGAPAAIGALGAVSGRRVLLVAAGILCLCLSVLAFSGVTLIVLVPALLFLRASVSDAAVPLARKPSSRRRLLVLVALAVPVALLAVTRLGVFGLLPLVALGGLAAGLGRIGAFRPRPLDALIAAAVIGLVIGATFAAFTLTQTICWDDYGGGNVVVRVLPDMPTEQSFVAPFGGGCSSGEPTVAGAALAGILLSGALGISGLSARVSRP